MWGAGSPTSAPTEVMWTDALGQVGEGVFWLENCRRKGPGVVLRLAFAKSTREALGWCGAGQRGSGGWVVEGLEMPAGPLDPF